MNVLQIAVLLIVFAGAFGAVLGWLVFQVMRRIDDYSIEVLLSLVLSLPDSEWKPFLLTATCMVVLFSIIIQGLTIAPLVEKLGRNPDLHQRSASGSSRCSERRSRADPSCLP